MPSPVTSPKFIPAGFGTPIAITATLTTMMFAAVRSQLRPAARTFRAVPRTLHTTSRVFAGHKAPALLGEGAKPGEVPTDENQATGLERLEILGKIEGIDVFDMNPLEMTRMGTLADPIKIYSLVSTLSHPLVAA